MDGHHDSEQSKQFLGECINLYFIHFVAYDFMVRHLR
jgi:hypothetical protein